MRVFGGGNVALASWKPSLASKVQVDDAVITELNDICLCTEHAGHWQAGSVADAWRSRVLRSCTGTPRRVPSVALGVGPRMPTHALPSPHLFAGTLAHTRLLLMGGCETALARGSRQTECIEGHLERELPTHLQQLISSRQASDDAHSMRLAETLPAVCDTSWFPPRNRSF